MQNYIKKYPEQATKVVFILDDNTPIEATFLSFNKSIYNANIEDCKKYIKANYKDRSIKDIQVKQFYNLELNDIKIKQ